MVDQRSIENTPEDIASFLHSCRKLDKTQKGDYLGDRYVLLRLDIMEAYI